MKDLKDMFTENKTKHILAVFAHPDDESFASGGLFRLAHSLNIKITLVCLTKGEMGNPAGVFDLEKVRSEELHNARAILGIDKLIILDYPDTHLVKTKKEWKNDILRIIERSEPDVVLTFDPSGITGHPDHVILSIELLNLIKKMKNKPLLLWRVPDKQEKRYFKDSAAVKYANKPTHTLNYGIKTGIDKIRAIYAHKSQIHSRPFKLRILEWFLFDHSERYNKVDLNKNYQYEIVEKSLRSK
jgi:N-acetylglucosamine malate deacetylase 2